MELLKVGKDKRALKVLFPLFGWPASYFNSHICADCTDVTYCCHLASLACGATPHRICEPLLHRRRDHALAPASHDHRTHINTLAHVITIIKPVRRCARGSWARTCEARRSGRSSLACCGGSRLPRRSTRASSRCEHETRCPAACRRAVACAASSAPGQRAAQWLAGSLQCRCGSR